MRREPVTYAVLLVAALALAFYTWTRQDQGSTGPGTVEPWHESADAIVALEYSRPAQRLEIRRMGEGDASYLWATVDTSAFLVGSDTGQRLLDGLAAPRALRDLGVPGARARQDYGLDTARTRLVIRFRQGSRELLMGGATYMTGDRYVLDRSSGHVYVLAQATVAPLDDPAQMLQEHRLHAFPAERIATVSVRGSGHTRSMRRLGPAVAAGGEPGTAPPAAWAPVAGPDQPDVAFASFMQRLDGLWAGGYAPREDPRAMTTVARVDYADRWGHPLGFLELFRRPGPGPNPEYFARTELTHVLVRLYGGVADNLAVDVAQGL